MGKTLRRIGEFYRSILMGNIGIFIFIGLLSVLFGENGWFPNEAFYDISQLAYWLALPAFVAYFGGEHVSGRNGGILAVMAVLGTLAGRTTAGILAAMIVGPAAGMLWKYIEKRLLSHVRFGMQMLTGNLLTGAAGAVLAAMGYVLISPALDGLTAGISSCMHIIMEHKLFCLLSVVVEPAKVFFLNNIVNHGILLPLALNQLQETGSSVLFLAETNPGPGLGMLAAFFLMRKKQRGEFASAMIAQGIGGIHEVYFPFVLSDLWLLFPLTAAGIAGNFWFDFVNAGLRAPVSPGSVLTILLMAGKGNILKAAAGMLLSFGVAFGGSLAVLRVQEKRAVLPFDPAKLKEAAEKNENKTEEAEKMPVHRIGFVCDAGVGSSAMGAALFRRRLAQAEMRDIEVTAAAADRIPEGLDMIVCQKDFRKLLEEHTAAAEIYTIESFVAGASYDELLELVKQRNS